MERKGDSGGGKESESGERKRERNSDRVRRLSERKTGEAMLYIKRFVVNRKRTESQKHHARKRSLFLA